MRTNSCSRVFALTEEAATCLTSTYLIAGTRTLPTDETFQQELIAIMHNFAFDYRW